jgi:RND superfamily putative drug exporter
MSTLARWCYRHRLVTVLVWLGVLVGLAVISGGAGTAYSTSLSVPNSESTKALDLLQKALPAAAGDTDTVVWHTAQGKATDSAVKQRITDMLGQVSHAPAVAGVTSPYSPGAASQISADGTTAYASITLTTSANDADKAQVEHIISLVKQAREPGLDVQYGGAAFRNAESTVQSTTEVLGIVAALIIMLLLFRSVWAALLPILTAVSGVASGVLFTGLLSHGFSIYSVAPTLAALVGLGVGIDYALFIVNRHRKGLTSGMTAEAAAVRALDTSGRAVVFAGLTVVVALLGQFALGVSFLDGMAVSAALTVALTVLAATTLLPAMLGLIGLRALSKKQRRALGGGHAIAEAADGGVWGRWSTKVMDKPRGKAVVALLVMLAISVPVLSLRLGVSDAGNDPSTSSSRMSYDLLSKGFGPGFNGPLILVAQTPADGDRAALTSLATELRGVSGVAQVAAAPTKPGQQLALVQVVPTTSPQSVQTTQLIGHLRDSVIPAAESGTTLRVYVGGTTATGIDFAHVIVSKLPLFILIIVALGFLLMMLAFRSFLIPLMGVAMNLLSMGVAFGAIVAGFQWGWFSESLNAGSAGPVEAFAPVLIISILFGLSMDYQVFLISRMHEEWGRTGDNAVAVRVGQTETGRVIAAAAVIMAVVFSAFMFGGQRFIAEFGLGLAVAVLLDVLMLRMILVPALMHMIGPRVWWLPTWIDRVLPHVSVEGQPDPVASDDHSQRTAPVQG